MSTPSACAEGLLAPRVPGRAPAPGRKESLVCRRLGGTNPGCFTGKPLKPPHDLALKYKDTILHVLDHQTSAEYPGSAYSPAGTKGAGYRIGTCGPGPRFLCAQVVKSHLRRRVLCSHALTRQLLQNKPVKSNLLTRMLFLGFQHMTQKPRR